MNMLRLAASALLAFGLSACFVAENEPGGPRAPVYDFGEGYLFIANDSMPQLQGDSLYVDLGYDCTRRRVILEHFKTGDSAYEVWLNIPDQIRGECAVPIVERHAFKVPDDVKNAASVKLVVRQAGKEELTRIELIKAPGQEGAPKQPVYDFGDGGSLVQNDSVPRLQGDSLYTHLVFDCTPAAFVELEYFKTGDSAYEIWLNTERVIVGACAIPVVDKRALKVPDEIKNAASVKLVVPQAGTSELVRIELKN